MTRKITIKRLTDPLKEAPFNNRPTLYKPGYIELREFSSLTREKLFATGVIAKAAYRTSLPIQKTANIFRPKAKKQTTYQLKRKAVATEQKTKTALKNAYENTGDVTASGISKGIGYLTAKPGLTAGFAATQALSKVGVPAAAAATGNPLVIGTVGNPLLPGLGTVAAPAFIRGYKGMNMAQKRRYVKGKQVAEKATNWMKGRSIKNTVKKGKRAAKSIMTPINPNNTPSYRLTRFTM